MVSQCDQTAEIDDREYLLRKLRSRVNARGSVFYMQDVLELLLNAVEAVRAPFNSTKDDDPEQIEATAVALADVATIIHWVAKVRLSRRQ